MTYYSQDDDFDCHYDDFEDCDELDDGEPVGSCDECDSNLYADDCWYVGDEVLCSRCAWIANGCPEPGKDDE